MRGWMKTCVAAAALMAATTTSRAAAQGSTNRETQGGKAVVAQLQRAVTGLEQARRALVELGDREIAERVGVLLREVRERAEQRGLAGPRGPDAMGLNDRARRVEIIELAGRAHAEAGHEEAADALRRFARIGRMQVEGLDLSTEPELGRGLTMGRLIGLIWDAARLYRGADRPEAARLCGDLAEFYLRRERERSAGRAQDERPEPAPRIDWTDRAQRVEVLRWTLEAHRAAGRAENVRYLERLVDIGERQLEGATPEALEPLLEGLSMERTIELVRQAARLWAEKGWEGRAAATAELARFYEARVAGHEPERAARDAREHAERRGGDEHRAEGPREGEERNRPRSGGRRRAEAEELAAERERLRLEKERLRARMAELQAELDRLRAELEARERDRRGGGDR